MLNIMIEGEDNIYGTKKYLIGNYVTYSREEAIARKMVFQPTKYLSRDLPLAMSTQLGDLKGDDLAARHPILAQQIIDHFLGFSIHETGIKILASDIDDEAETA